MIYVTLHKEEHQWHYVFFCELAVNSCHILQNCHTVWQIGELRRKAVVIQDRHCCGTLWCETSVMVVMVVMYPEWRFTAIRAQIRITGFAKTIAPGSRYAYLQECLQDQGQLQELQLDFTTLAPISGHTWLDIFPTGMPTVMVSASTLERLALGKHIKRLAPEGKKMRFAKSPEILAIQSWIFVSSYGRHGQFGSRATKGASPAPQMLIDWTGAMPPEISYIRVIAVRPEEQQVCPCLP